MSQRPSSQLRSGALLFLIVVLLATFVRLPFLLHGDRFFDSDEAVEGLMARHVLLGDHPAFLWGQRYKGVPEVYLAALFFRMAGAGVIPLKAASLAVFALFSGVQFLLVERISSRRVAWVTTALTLVGPPSLVLWSLSGSAEIVWTLLAGAVLCLALHEWQRSGALAALAVAGGAFGFGLWVQQYIVYYVVAIGATTALTLAPGRKWLLAGPVGSESPAWRRALSWMLLCVAIGYVLLGFVAFASGGFDTTVFGRLVGIRHPQKLWRIGAGVLLAWGAVRAWGHLSGERGRASRRVLLVAGGGFVVGYVPALLGSLTTRGAVPIARMDVRGLTAAIGPMVREMLPVLFGFREPGGTWLVTPWLAVPLVVLAGISATTAWHGRRPLLFHVFLVTTPAVFLISGAYVDVQSYRYLVPLFAALPFVWAIGVDAAWRRHWMLGATLGGVVLGTFVLQQVGWYRSLTPDAQSAAVIGCLDARGARGAYADYWTSYKVTFLTAERLIVVPDNGTDRHREFRQVVDGLPSPPHVTTTSTGAITCE